MPYIGLNGNFYALNNRFEAYDFPKSLEANVKLTTTALARNQPTLPNYSTETNHLYSTYRREISKRIEGREAKPITDTILFLLNYFVFTLQHYIFELVLFA